MLARVCQKKIGKNLFIESGRILYSTQGDQLSSNNFISSLQKWSVTKSGRLMPSSTMLPIYCPVKKMFISRVKKFMLLLGSRIERDEFEVENGADEQQIWWNDADECFCYDAFAYFVVEIQAPLHPSITLTHTKGDFATVD
ncbi:hypothetical protein P8452_74823 [Trifolium repens]|nr:hypothetical protein P8452_74823 [Trifolium repens]